MPIAPTDRNLTLAALANVVIGTALLLAVTFVEPFREIADEWLARIGVSFALVAAVAIALMIISNGLWLLVMRARRGAADYHAV
jgi:hypothetical protein